MSAPRGHFFLTYKVPSSYCKEKYILSVEMKLGKYLKKQGITQKKFAEMVDVARPLITQIIGGTKNPSLLLAKRIEKASNGMVTTDDLVNPSAPSRLKSKKKKKISEKL